MVPVLEDGIVVFMGEKEGYGNTVIVEQVNGVDVYYSNINSNNIKLYDYVEKGKLLGEVKDTKLYLVFQKDGKFLNYKKYL
jgi:stage IV sporulation protein FA